MSKNQQISQQKQILDHAKFCKDMTDDITLSALQLKLGQIKKLFKDFEANQKALEEACADKKEIDVQLDVRSQYSDQYYYCHVILQERITKLEDEKALSQQNARQDGGNGGANRQKEVKLPRIEMTSFSGYYEDWATFHDLFHSLIHTNNSIDNVQKLHYLKSNVQGDAERLLKSITITDANYEEAWKKLKDRYDHKRFIVDSLLKSFFKQPSVSSENHNEIKRLVDKSSEIIQSLRLQAVPVAHWDVILVHVIVSKLDPETHKQWELKQKKDELPTFTDLEEFLHSRWQSLEMIQKDSPVGQSMQYRHQNQSNKFKPSHTTFENQKHRADSKCSCCSDTNHKLYGCPKYNQSNVSDRKNLLKSNKLCFNCLASGHSIVDCNSLSRCKTCNGKHHTSIHIDTQHIATNIPAISSKTNQNADRKLSGISSSDSNNTRVLLATAVIYVHSSNGEKFPVKALVDPGSMNTIIVGKLAQKLGLVQKADDTQIIGLGDIEIKNLNSSVTLHISSHVDTNFSMDIESSIMDIIAGDLPLIPVHRQKWPHLMGLKFADPHFERPSPVEVLLGAEAYEEILQEGIIRKKNHSPTAINSSLGWLLFGVVKNRPQIVENPSSTTCLVSLNLNSLDKTLKSFWEMESIPEMRKFTVKEQQAENIFLNSVHRSNEGRYVVALPFDPDQQSKEIGDSRKAALSSLFRLEERFKKNIELMNRYKSYIQTLIESHHIEIVPNDRLNIENKSKFYLPHHPVFKEESLTTKLRVVFDASRKSSTGVSLNDKLLVGPKTQDDLFSILIRWRKHEFVFVADVEKMYRQVKIIEEHQDFQRLLWRFDKIGPIFEYRITTVIDGTASASFLATRALKQLAEDHMEEYPEASRIINEDFYVDDMSSGTHSIQKAKQLQNDIIHVMNQGKFVLRKWFSNNKEILENVPEENRHDPSVLVEVIENTIKTLGVYWNQVEDSFEFKITPCSNKNHLTKRELLSDISRLFDPIGWLAPSTIIAKILMQSLWEVKDLDWDDRVPDDKMQIWRNYRVQLHLLENIKIPRWIGTTEIIQMQLHGFGDASSSAYSAVVYARVVQSDGVIRVNIISAKTKVAPIKTISIPKLELCASVLISKLISKVKDSLKLDNVESYIYSDNTTVLAWIKSHPNHYNVFVANRITEIQTLTNITNWFFVSTDENPADCASRGVFPCELAKHKLWWHGPDWLSKPKNEWPSYDSEYTTDLERKKAQSHTFLLSSLQQDEYLFTIMKRHSTLSRLLWNSAYVTKFCSSSRFRPRKIAEHPDAQDLRMALIKWTKYIQHIAFKEELVNLKAGEELLMRSKLKKLCPFIDQNGLIRVGGRLSQSKLVFNAKHPIILPKDNYFTQLVIKQAHKYTLHGGPTLMSTFLQNYWIFSRSAQIRKVIGSCVICFPYQSKPAGQIMADLPSSRVTQHRTFLHTGVDFAGPIITKTYTGRSRGIHSNPTQKSYICIFVCMATKAVHIDLVSNMGASAFLACFIRFVSRRGKCTDLYSDCGKNFLGANKMLRDQFKMLMMDSNLQSHLAHDGTTWHFNPPLSPNFGGLWEAGVKSTKYHLKRLAGNSTFTFEELTTLLCQIEACLNSRPLCQISNDINDLSYLTPGHFLIGDAPITVPEISLLDENITRLSRWNLIQRIYQEFWKIWHKEYLSRLQQRPKWFKTQENIQIGQLVLLREDDTPPAKWPIARILKVYPGDDVGAGTAGCLLANRLSESHKVLLLEAGGEPHPLQRIPGLAFFMVNYKETDYSHRTVPQRRACFACENKRVGISQGRNLGGSSNINWQVFLRGSPRDYNNWAQITGDHSWSYQEMLPYFKRSENYQGDTPDRDAHGFEGELMIDPPAYTGMAKEFIRAGQELGYEHVDLNARYEEGFDTVYSPIEGGERRSSFQAFLEPVRDRDNLIIRKYSHVNKILVRGFDSTAFGIEYKRHGMKKFAYATKELILSAGAIESAKLLLLSGIGPGTQLADLGIPVIADLPVGQNLQDHLSTFLGPFFVDPPRSFLIDRDISLRGFYEYKSDGHGPLSTSLFQAAAMISSHHLKHSGTWNWPDIQLLFSSMGAHKTFPKDLSHAFNLNAKFMKRYYDHASGRDSFFISVAVARPYARGEVILEKKDPWAPVSINPRYLENDWDMKIMINGVKTALQLVENTTSFQSLRARFTNRKFPGCDHLGFRSDEYWECYIRHYSVSLNDVAGTCAMGNPHMGVGGVVNSRLEVIGVNHLRVIDASVMPKIVGSPTQAAVIAIAEKGADLIIEAWKSREGMFSTMPVSSLTTLPPIPGGPQANNLDPTYGAPPEPHTTITYYGPPPEQSNNISPNYGPPSNNNNNGGYINNNNQQSGNNVQNFNNNENNNNQQEINFSPPPQFSPPPLPPQTTPINNNNGFTNSFTQASDIQPVNYPSSTDLPPAPFGSSSINQQYGSPSEYPATQMSPPPIAYGAPPSYNNNGGYSPGPGPPPQPPAFGNPIFGNDQDFNRPFGNNINYNGQDPRNIGDAVTDGSTDIPNLAQDPLPGDPDDENPPRDPNTGLPYETTTPTYDAQASEQLSTTTEVTGTTGSFTTSATTGDSQTTMSQEISNVFQNPPNRLRNQQASRPKVNFITHDTKKRPGVQISNPHPDLYYNNLSPTNPSGLPSAVNLPHHPLGPVYFRNPEYTVRDPIAIKMGPSTSATTTSTTSQKPPTLMDDEEHDVANTIQRFTTVKPSDSSLSEYYQKHKPKQRPNPIVRYTGLGVTNRVPSTANVADIYYRIMDTTSTDVTTFNNAPELVDFDNSADQTPANSNFFANINSTKIHPHKNQNQQQDQGFLLEHNDSLASTSNSFWVNKAAITPGFGFQQTTKSPATTNPYWTNNSPKPELHNNEPEHSFDILRQGSSPQSFTIDNHASGQTLSQTFFKNEQNYNLNNNNNAQKSDVNSRPKIKRRPGKVVKIKSELSWTTRPTTTTTPKPYSVSKQTHVQTYGLAQSANDQMYLDKGVTSQTIVPSGKPFVKPDWTRNGESNDDTHFSKNNNDYTSGRKSKNMSKAKPESDEDTENDKSNEQPEDSLTSHSENEAQTQHWPPKIGKQNLLINSFITHSNTNDDYEYDQKASPTTQAPKTWISTVAPNSKFAVNLELIPPKSEEDEDDEDRNSRSTLKSLANNIKKSTKGLWNAVTGVVWKGNFNENEEDSSTSTKSLKKYSPSSTTARPYNHVPSQDHTDLIKNAIEFAVNPSNFKSTPPEFFAQEKPGIFKRPPFHIDPNLPPPPSYPTASSETLNTQIPDDSYNYNPTAVHGLDYATEQGQLDSNEIAPPLTPPPLVYPNELKNYRPMFPRPEPGQNHDSATNTYDDNERIPGLNPPDFTDNNERPHQNNNNYQESAEVLSNLAANLNLNPITQNPPTPLHVEIKSHDMDLSTTPRPFLPAFTSTQLPGGNVFHDESSLNSFRKNRNNNNQNYDKHLHSFNGANFNNQQNGGNNRENEFKTNSFPQNNNDHSSRKPALGPEFQGSQNQEAFENSPADRFNLKNSHLDTGVFTSEVFAVPLPPGESEKNNLGQIPDFFSHPEKNNQNAEENRFPVFNGNQGDKNNDRYPGNSESNEFNYSDKDSRGSGSTEKYPEYPNGFEPYQNQDGTSAFTQNSNIQSPTPSERFPNFVSTVAPNIQSIFKGRPIQIENFNPEAGPGPSPSPTPGSSHYNRNEHTGKPHFNSEEPRLSNPTPTPIFGARIPNHQRNKNIFNLPERISAFGVNENNFGSQSSHQTSFEQNPNIKSNEGGVSTGNNGNANFQDNSGSFGDIIKDAYKENENNFEQSQYPAFGNNGDDKFGNNQNGNNFEGEQNPNSNINNFNPNSNNDNYNSGNSNDQFNPNTNFDGFTPENSNFNDGNSQPDVNFGANNNNVPPDNFNSNFVQNAPVSYSNPTKFEENFESTTINNFNNGNQFTTDPVTPTAVRQGSKEYDITTDPDTVDITVEDNKNLPNRFKGYDITSDPDTVDITEDDPDFPDRFNNIRRNFVQRRRRNRNGMKNGRRRRLRLIRHPNAQNPSEENNDAPGTAVGTRNRPRRRNQMRNGRRNPPGTRLQENSVEINRRSSNLGGEIAYIDPPQRKAQKTQTKANEMNYAKNNSHNNNRNARVSHNNTQLEASGSRLIASVVNAPAPYAENYQNSKRQRNSGDSNISRSQNQNQNVNSSPNNKPIASIARIPPEIISSPHPHPQSGYQFPNSNKQKDFQNLPSPVFSQSKNFLVSVGSPTTLKPVSVLQDVTPKRNIASITNIDIARKSNPTRRVDLQQPSPLISNVTNSVEYDQQPDDYYDKLQSFFASFYDQQSTAASLSKAPPQSNSKSSSSQNQKAQNGSRRRSDANVRQNQSRRNSRVQTQSGQSQTGSSNSNANFRTKGNSNSRSSNLGRESRLSNSSVHKRGVGVGEGVSAKLASSNNKHSQQTHLPIASAVSYVNSQSRPKSKDTPHNHINSRTKPRPESTVKNKSISAESLRAARNSRPNLMEISHRNSKSKA